MSAFPGGPALSIDGKTFTNFSNMIELYAQHNTSLNNCTARASSGSAGYTVPIGKTLKLFGAILVWGNAFANASNDSASIGFCTNDVGFPSNTVPTGSGFIYGCDPQSGGVSRGLFDIASPPDLRREVLFDFDIATGLYVLIRQSSASSNIKYRLFGYLV